MHVRADHIRQLFRLVAEAHELRAADQPANQHFLTGLARITRSQVAIQMTASGLRRDAPPSVSGVYDAGWGTASDRERVYSFVQRMPLGSDPLAAALLDRKRAQLTLTRADVVSTHAWANTQVRNEIHRPSGIDDTVLSLRRRQGTDLVDVLVLKRAWGDAPFSADERELLDLVQSECRWLFEGAAPAVHEHARDLTRRERETLDLLLQGDSQKGIAATLGLSVHTVHQYVKVIYRKTGVGSRAELMAWALSRGAR